MLHGKYFIRACWGQKVQLSDVGQRLNSILESFFNLNDSVNLGFSF